jgi:xanthine dehydrogenase accessory factor
MTDLFQDIQAWQAQGKPVALATVVWVSGSSLRPMGAKMAVTNTHDLAGSVSGGCVEGAVYEEAQQVISTRHPKLLHYGVSDDNAWSVGLICGGSIQVFVESLDSPAVLNTHACLTERIACQEMVALVTVLNGDWEGQRLLVWPDGRTQGELANSLIRDLVIEAAIDRFRSQDPAQVELAMPQGQVSIFIEVYPPKPRLIIIGAAHLSIPLVELAHTLGFYTMVIDARSAFATPQRFAHVDELIVEWPASALERLRLDESCYLAFLSHDEKLDYPALQVALDSHARYIGALGSRKAHLKRIQALRDAGVSEEKLNCIHAPIGLNLGAVQPEEIALSILAEIVAARHGKLS